MPTQRVRVRNRGLVEVVESELRRPSCGWRGAGLGYPRTIAHSVTLRRWAVVVDSRSALLAAALVVGFALPFEAIPPLVSTPWFGVTDDKVLLLVLVAGWLMLGVGALRGGGGETLGSAGEARRDASRAGPCVDFGAAAGGGGPRTGSGTGAGLEAGGAGLGAGGAAVVASPSPHPTAASPSVHGRRPRRRIPRRRPRRRIPRRGLGRRRQRPQRPQRPQRRHRPSATAGVLPRMDGWRGCIARRSCECCASPALARGVRQARGWCCRRLPSGAGCYPRWCSSA